MPIPSDTILSEHEIRLTKGLLYDIIKSLREPPAKGTRSQALNGRATDDVT
jgi:hypothetical protein